jgi:hypothetical protein
VRFAAAIDDDLRRYLERLAADAALSVAEINRRVGERAETLGSPRPSYAAVRLLVCDLRPAYREPSWGSLLLDVGLRIRTPDVLVDKAVGLMDKDLPEDYGLRGTSR